MNWTETRQRLIDCGIAAERLPEKWQPYIDLSGANLGRANLSGANLRGANLGWAYLGRANLSGADLGRADLGWANLGDITVAWQSHDLLSEILFRAAGDDTTRRMLAGMIRISTDWCWDTFLALDISAELRNWALAELRRWVKDGDGAPEALRVIEAESPAA